MNSLNKKFIYGLIACLLIFALTVVGSVIKPSADIKERTFLRLEKIRKTKKKKIIKYFDNIKAIAYSIKNDQAMRDWFKALKRSDYKISRDLIYEIDKHSVVRYGDFYDILFIDSSGYVFHSIRQESDFQRNIFNGELSSSILAKKIKQSPGESFVEYEFYQPSDEPAAFFAVPFLDGDTHIGWFVLQFTINRVNSILTNYDGLGRSGEVYLVNKKRFMLSDSRFLDYSTILKQNVNTSAVKNAMAVGAGAEVITDYRGMRVFSSYEKFDYFGTQWVIIAEIDENEVITEYYKKDKRYLQKRILGHLSGTDRKMHPDKKEYHKTKRVDMNEFGKAVPGTLLKTSGVAMCTCVVIMNPGKFCYLAHLSPTDKINFPKKFTGISINNIKTDFLGRLIRKVKHYDVYPYELTKLHFTIIAPHADSFEGTVDALLDCGLELANIKFMYNSRARCANVLADVSQNRVKVEWVSNGSSYQEYAGDIEDLGIVVKKVAGSVL